MGIAVREVFGRVAVVDGEVKATSTVVAEQLSVAHYSWPAVVGIGCQLCQYFRSLSADVTLPGLVQASTNERRF